MVNFAELKQRAEKAKDASVTKMVNTRDKYSSVPSSKTTWDPNYKRAPPAASAGSAGNGPPPPPLRTRPDDSGSTRNSVASLPPPLAYGSRPDVHSPPLHSHIPPPPTRTKSSYPSQTGSADQVNHIDWANLSQEDKDEFFGWLDEFFSRYLDIALPSRRPSVVMKGSSAVIAQSAGPPPVNLNSRPSW
ncbi:hypothetical protein DEU56DRAFT_829732 [Suillus clintonianus]|uniref:uncharacterized protein n=1 Tax=Suillus clintonianus TaxID=1904413 RepID=UPI001B884C8C|nr:uncharacterized protein DEU56DRAFT_829732 [Suillus clintonianus]KAG2123415.1 hypothetical protein DEU56DRAFT_829732 [Suillus clintonianus]